MTNVGASTRAAGNGISSNVARCRRTKTKNTRNATTSDSSSCGSAATTGMKHSADAAAACTDLCGLTGSSVRYMPTARNAKANAAGRNTITVSIGRLAESYNPSPSDRANHSSDAVTRTASERVNTPARAQNDSTLNGAAANSSNAVAAATWPSVHTEATISTSSHGVGGAGTPVPVPNAHEEVAASTS